MIKRTTVIIFAFIIIFNTLSVFASSETQPEVTLTITSANGEANTDVKISLTISANSGMAAATFALKYDKTKLEVYKVSTGKALITGISDVFSAVANSKVTLAYINMDRFNGAGSILDVIFKVKKTASGTIPVTLEVVELKKLSGENIPYTINNGSITVTSSYISIGHDSSNNSEGTNSSNSSNGKLSQTTDYSYPVSSKSISGSVISGSISSKTSSDASEILQSNSNSRPEAISSAIENLNIFGNIIDSNSKSLSNHKVELHSLVKKAGIDSTGNFSINSVDFGEHILYVKDEKDTVIGTLLFIISHGDKTAKSSNGITVNNKNIYLDLMLTGSKLTIQSVGANKNSKDNSPIIYIILAIIAVLLATGIFIYFRKRR